MISDNVVFDNTWWTKDASSGIVLAESKGSGVNTMTRNTVFGNRNFLPFYSPDLHSLEHAGNSVPGYADWNQDYVIDGYVCVYVCVCEGRRFGRASRQFDHVYT